MDKKWFLYILKCADGTLYTGITDNVPRRLSEHNSGRGAKYTRGRGPVELGFCKVMASKSEALREEYRIKQLPHSVKADMCMQYSEKVE